MKHSVSPRKAFKFRQVLFYCKFTARICSLGRRRFMCRDVRPLLKADLGRAQPGAAHGAPVGQEEPQGRTRPPALHQVHLILPHQCCSVLQAAFSLSSFLLSTFSPVVISSIATATRRSEARVRTRSAKTRHLIPVCRVCLCCECGGPSPAQTTTLKSLCLSIFPTNEDDEQESGGNSGALVSVWEEAWIPSEGFMTVRLRW